MANIIPAILARDEQDFRKKVATIAPRARMIQIDVMNGTLVPEHSFGEVGRIEQMHLSTPFEAHLMVNAPEQFAKEWVRIGAARVVIHVECEGNKEQALLDVRHTGRIAGIAINPETDLSALTPFIPFVQYILVMGVHPGAMGRSFAPETIDRVRALKRAYPHILIGVDGGVSTRKHIARELARAGADDLIVGSAIWNAEDPLVAYDALVTQIK